MEVIVLIEGEAGEGKTVLARNIQKFLEPSADVNLRVFTSNVSLAARDIKRVLTSVNGSRVWNEESHG